MVRFRQKCKTVHVHEGLVGGVSQQIADLAREGVLLIFTDGSSQRTCIRRVPRVGGIGVYVPATEHSVRSSCLHLWMRMRGRPVMQRN